MRPTKTRILLIFPPFALPRVPHLAIPALAAYLKQKGIDVVCLDANIEFFHYFLTSENIDMGRSYAEGRFLALNDGTLKTTAEQYEYVALHGILTTSTACTDVETALSSSHNCSYMKRQESLRLGLACASAPLFPEKVIFDQRTDRPSYSPPGNRYSTRDIFRSLKKEGIFSGFFEKILPSFIDGKNFDIVGISVSFDDQIHAAFHCATVVRRLLPHTHIVMGGTYVTAGMANIKASKVFDYVDSLVMEDGEEPLETLIHEVTSDLPDLKRVPSLVYRDGDVIRRNPVKPPLPFTSLPCPDYLVFPLERYTIMKKHMGLPFRTSRGCYWGRCTYCRSGGTYFCGFEQSPAEYMHKNLLAASESTGVTYFSFADNVTDPVVLDDFSKMLLASGKNVRWTTNLRLDKSVTMERCIGFRKAGCIAVAFGLETINPRLLKLIDKGISPETANKVLSNAAWACLFSEVFMMVGFPTETEEEARFYQGKMKELVHRGLIGGYLYNPLFLIPGSKYYMDPENFGITDIHVQEGRDIEGSINDFQTAGMSRKTAWKLANEFCFPEPAYQVETSIGGRSHPVKHNIQELIAGLQSEYAIL